MKATRRPDENVLRLESEHLLYEIDMLVVLADLTSSQVVDRTVERLVDHQALAIRNAVIEAFAIHMRQLVAFLSPVPSNAKPDDVFAVDYVPGWGSTRTPFDHKGWSVDTARVNKHVAHLTLSRATNPADATFYVSSLAAALGGALSRFVDALPPTAPVVDDFRRLAHQRLAMVGADRPAPTVTPFPAPPLTGGTATVGLFGTTPAGPPEADRL
jgi:hypothetical protein